MTELNDKEVMNRGLALNNLYAKLVELPVSSMLGALVTIGRSMLQMTVEVWGNVVETSRLICALFVE